MFSKLIWCDVIIVDEIVLYSNQMFNKMRNSYVTSFLVLCLTPFAADVTVIITLLLSQIYVCTTSYRLFNMNGRKRLHQQRGPHILKIYVINVTKLISKVALYQVCFKLNKYQINQKECSNGSLRPTYLTLKKANFYRVPMLTSLILS